MAGRVVFRYQSSSYIDYANTIKLPSFLVVNLEGSWHVNRFSVFAVINNLTNQKYYTNGLLAYDGKPRYFIQSAINYNLGLRFKWK